MSTVTNVTIVSECDGVEQFIHEGLCVTSCPAGMFLDITTTSCMECATDCVACTDASTCVDCGAKRLENGQCVEACPYNTYYDGSSCVECLDGCIGCSGPDHSDCDECDIAFNYVPSDE